MVSLPAAYSIGPIPDGWSARTKPLARRTLCVYKSETPVSLEGLTVARYDDVNMDSNVSSISMSINNRLLKQLLSIQRLPPQSRFISKTPRIEILLRP